VDLTVITTILPPCGFCKRNLLSLSKVARRDLTWTNKGKESVAVSVDVRGFALTRPTRRHISAVPMSRLEDRGPLRFEANAGPIEKGEARTRLPAENQSAAKHARMNSRRQILAGE